MNNRKPIYGRDNKVRVISVHGERWVCQRLVGQIGRSAQEDPWTDHHRPVADRAVAIGQMEALG